MKKTFPVKAALSALLLIAFFSACDKNATEPLNPEQPLTIKIWHYYNGAILNAFDRMLMDFNETLGAEKGVIAEGVAMGNIMALEESVIDAVSDSSQQMPHIFATYADTAYIVEKYSLLANLDDFFTKNELSEYHESFIEEGRIGKNGELRIFPVAKATEVLMLNETDWLPFAADTGVSYNDLSTLEGLSRVSELYYEWDRERTGNGKSFFGRDSMANLFVAAAEQFGTDLFSDAEKSAAEAVLRRIWDSYYLPYIKGHYYSYGKFRSDDAKAGDILAYVGSSTSASYFPEKVTKEGASYEVAAKILPVPGFQDGDSVIIQQGAGMAVIKSDKSYEYACALFLKWFTEAENNIEFCSHSGYIPVKKEAMDHDRIISVLTEKGYKISTTMSETIKVSLESIKSNRLYANKAFDGAVVARDILETNLQSKASADREAVLMEVVGGKTVAEAVAVYNTDENFNAWRDDIMAKLSEAVN